MKKPILLIMAAGMGSRYGGLKQIDPVGPGGEIIIDYSIYDAKKAGFEDVVFIIKKEIETQFKDAIGKRAQKYMNVHYAYQDINNIPNGFDVPQNRVKPWGTAHAVLSAKNLVDGPFAAINADDFYGFDAFKTIYDYISAPHQPSPYPFCMVAYRLENTLTENGYVSRGVCTPDDNGNLINVTEHTKIEKTPNGPVSCLENGEKILLSGDTPVSMNMWGFTKDFINEAEKGFEEFLRVNLPKNPEKCEYYLPSVVSKLIDEKKAGVKLLSTASKWYGVTYKEDKQTVMQALKDMHKVGIYPEKL